MEALGIYLLKVSALMGVFYLAYFVFLRKETFFNSNRWFLLAGLITSLVLPFVTYTKIVWVDPAPVVDNYNTVSQAYHYVPTQEPAFEINWFQVMLVLYGIGISVFIIKFLIDCFTIKQLIEKPKAIKRSNFYLIDTEKVQSPFSFFNYIVYNSSALKEDELENILQHELVHSAQKHSFDMMIAQIFCIAFWFNPIVWLYKKAIAQNLEFIADAEATKNVDDIKSYQKTLLKVTMQSQCIAITNPFYQSLIKKRIVMLNKNQSSKKNYWKYFVVLPLLAFFMFQFQMRVLAQEKSLPKIQNPQKKSKVVTVVIDKNSTDAEINKDIEMLKKDFDITLKVSKIKRNTNGEITGIKIKFKDNEGNSADSQYDGKSPIQPIQIVKEFDGDKFFGIGTNEFFNKEKSRLVNVKKIKHINKDGEDIQVLVEGDEDAFDWADVIGIDPPLPPDAPAAPKAIDAPSPPDAPAAPKMKKTIVIKKNGTKKEFWVNGERVTEDFAMAVDPNEIGSVNVFNTKGPKGEKGSKDFTDEEIEVIQDSDKKIVIVSKSKDGKQKRTIETINVRKITDETKAEMERIRPEIEQAKREAMEARKEAMEARKAALKAREEALKEREEAIKEAQKAREEAAKARKK